MKLAIELENVRSTDLVKIIRALSDADIHVSASVQGTGGTRSGDLVFFNREPHAIKDTTFTRRKLFFTLSIDGKDTHVRPHKDTFEYASIASK